ncbi:MAG: hypothetical protein ACP5II_08170 [Infirmifilum sp.]
MGQVRNRKEGKPDKVTAIIHYRIGKKSVGEEELVVRGHYR